MAGISYDVVDDYGVRNSGEFFYRACIRKFPHSEIASACYAKYQEDVYFGYTSRGGVYIPAGVRTQLSELESLSSPSSQPEGSKRQKQ
jgi:hypothetical protein